MRIYGIHPVIEALRAKRVTALRVSFRADDRLTEVVRLAEQQGIPVRRAKVDELDRFVQLPASKAPEDHARQST